MTHQPTPFLDRIRAINKKKRRDEKRRCAIITDKSVVENILDEMDMQRMITQKSRERFLPKKL